MKILIMQPHTITHTLKQACTQHTHPHTHYTPTHALARTHTDIHPRMYTHTLACIHIINLQILMTCVIIQIFKKCRHE